MGNEEKLQVLQIAATLASRHTPQNTSGGSMAAMMFRSGSDESHLRNALQSVLKVMGDPAAWEVKEEPPEKTQA